MDRYTGTFVAWEHTSNLHLHSLWGIHVYYNDVNTIVMVTIPIATSQQLGQGKNWMPTTDGNQRHQAEKGKFITSGKTFLIDYL